VALMSNVNRLIPCVVVFLAAGCSTSAPPPTGTGSREVVTKYYEALAKQDWPAAYGELHAETRKRLDQPTFERRAVAYSKRLGFVLDKATIRSSDENGDQAIAQLYLKDAKGSSKHRFREGVLLKREASAWKIVLPERFGESLQ
jgi:hypothetical protein